MTTENASANAYLRTKVLTASPEELRLMLLDGCIKFLRQGRNGLVAKDYEACFVGFSKCRDILIELMTAIRPDIAPELCGRVSSLYTFLYAQVVEAGFDKDVAKADKVIELLEFERETWVLAMQKLAEERAGAKFEMANAMPEPAYRPLSVQG